MVSAPPAASRNSGPVSLWKRGSDSTTPGVSAQPGCIACTPMPSPDHLVGEHRQQLDLGPLAACVGRRAGVLPAQELRVVGAQPLPVHPARGHEHHPRIVTTRAPAGAARSSAAARARAGSSSARGPAETRCGSAASRRRCARARRGARRRAPSTKRRTSSRSETSQRSTATCAPGTSASSSALTRSPFWTSRTTSRTSAPRRARPSAVAYPSPDVAPVTATVRPASAPGAGSAGQPGNLRRTAGPIRLKPGATVRSIAVSTARANVSRRELMPAR